MLTHIDPRYLDQVWPMVAPLLARAVDKAHGEIDLAQLRMQIGLGGAELLVWEDESGKTAATVEFVSYPNYRVAYVSFISGHITDEAFTRLQDWSRNMGASKLQFYGDDAASALLARRGFSKAYNVMRIDL